MIGVNRFGQCSLIGRIYAVAIYIPKNIEFKSYAISFDKRVKELKEKCVYSIEYATVEEINGINILRASCLAMNRAIKSISEKIKYDDCDICYPFESIKEGKGSKEIRAAYLIAKYEYQKYIKEICSNDKEIAEKYKLIENKGRRTKDHIETLKKYGYSKYHRFTSQIKCES